MILYHKEKEKAGIAGYSFSESGTAGGNGNETDFNIVFNDDTDQSLVWSVADNSNLFFDGGETITFESLFVFEKLTKMLLQLFLIITIHQAQEQQKPQKD